MLTVKEITEDRNVEDEEMPDLLEHMFPPKITRRDALALFSGFDKNANRKIIGAAIQTFKRNKNV